jgi:hypothetical protein
MSYDFGEFIQESKKSCKTKLDFISKIDNEKTLLSKSIESQSYMQRYIYSKRLDNAKFCVQKGTMKVPDPYNDALRNLLDGLS